MEASRHECMNRNNIHKKQKGEPPNGRTGQTHTQTNNENNTKPNR